MPARLAVAVLAIALASGCLSTPDPAPSTAPLQPSRAFDSGRSWADLNALVEIGPRVMATEGADRARAYLRAELAKLGLETVEQSFTVEVPGRSGQLENLALHNLLAAIPGASSDVLLLATQYDTREHEGSPFPGANDGASGAAVVLELARALAEEPLTHTVWVAFFEGEAERDSGDGSDGYGDFGSGAFARHIQRLEASEGLRLAVILDRVCDADLRIARDLRSDRSYRNEFWRAAERLGHGDVFPSRSPYESPVSSHLTLSSQGVGPVVALVDTHSGDDDLERCSQRSLGVVGEVTLEALERISKRLAKVDRFADAPTVGAVAPRLGQFPAELAARPSSFNGTVRVVDVEGKRNLVTTSNGKRLLQSSMDLARPHRLVAHYTQIVSMVTDLHPSPQRVFNIGLGGGVLPRFHLHHYAGSEVQSVEIDPVVIALAEEYFEVIDPRHTILEGDGAALLRESEGRFDVIWIDAYTTDEGVPEVFTKRRFIDALPGKLATGGIAIANLWAKEPEAFERLVDAYQRDFSHGVRISIPGGVNDIVAVGDFPGLTCAAFGETLEEWSARGLVDLEWTEQDAPLPERCSDL